ncbi:MAG TPA: glycosyltransferase family 2 protein [Solirubrobacteraceae bacterium]|nr:glycosyltransferase family 2 protein [Solirubrobacteraceae bacterium]
MEATKGQPIVSSVESTPAVGAGLGFSKEELSFGSSTSEAGGLSGEAPEPQPRARTPIVDRKGRTRQAEPWNPGSAAHSPRVSVIMPTLNEAKNLPHVFAKLPRSLHEVIVVDGFSTDDTLDVARRLRPDAKIVLQQHRGKGDALRCGFEAATGDILVMLDADGSADPAEIPTFVKALVEGADFAKGSRFRDGGGSSDITQLRRVGNRALNRLVNVLFGTSYSDLCYGYNAFWRHCLGAMNVDCTGFEVETLINIRVARAGLDIREVPSFERDRMYGQSNLRTFRDGGRVLRTIVRERLRRVVEMPACRDAMADVHQHAMADGMEAAPVEAS